MALVETNDPASAISWGHYKASVTYEDAGSGASTAVALSGFPVGVVVLCAWLEITEEFAGEADATVIVGDTANDNELIEAFTLDGVAPTKVAATTTGAAVLPGPESDYATAGLDITFAATELGDLTAGALTVHILYHKPE